MGATAGWRQAVARLGERPTAEGRARRGLRSAWAAHRPPLRGQVWAGARRPLGPRLRAGSRRESAPSRLFPLPRSPPKRRGSFHPPPRSGRFAPRPRRTAASPPSAPSLGSAARRAAVPAHGAASPPAASSTHKRNASRVEIGGKAEAVRLRRPTARRGSQAESDVASYGYFVSE